MIASILVAGQSRCKCPIDFLEALIKWTRQLLGVRWPGSALVQLTYLARHGSMLLDKAAPVRRRPKRRRAAALQGVDAST
jgi:hypothetical protein